MDEIAHLINALSINNFEMGSAHWVDVTHINNPGSFYVRPTVCRSYLPILHSQGDHLLADEVHCGMTILFKSKLIQIYVRGQVLFTHTKNAETTCDIFAPDYGCLEKSVPLKRIRKVGVNLNIPPLAIHCQLADCKPLGTIWNRKVIECMKYFVAKERARMVIRGKSAEAVIVELYNSCPDDIATMMALCGYSTFGYEDNVLSRFTGLTPEKNYYKFKALNIDDELIVRVQSGESLESFYVATISDYKSFLSERDNFTLTVKNQDQLQITDIKINLPVGVYLDTYMKYERAIVKEIMEAKLWAKVQLVDWGKIVEVPLSRLKSISKFFLESPAIAMYCSSSSKVWDNGLHKFLYPGYEFKIKVTEVGSNFDTPHKVQVIPKVST